MLSANIKKYRTKLGLSQEQLSKKAGVTYTTLIKIEGGFNNNPTIKTIKKISDALNVKIDEIMEE